MLINQYQTEWTEKEIEFLRLNHKTMSIKEMSESLIGRTRSSVQNKCNKMGFKKESKYKYNRDFFEEIDTEEKAYWLGFIYADGYVSYSETNHEMGIELSAKDINHLRKFNKSIDGNVEVSVRTRATFSDVKHKMCAIRLYSKKIVNDLINKNIDKDKTYSKKFPIVEDKLFIHFLRGYFDGDGCIFIDKSKNVIHYDITSANEDILEYIHKKMYEEYGISSYITKEEPRLDGTVPTYKICFKGMTNGFKFGTLIYDNATIYLERKKNLFDIKSIELDIENRINKKGKIGTRYDCLSS